MKSFYEMLLILEKEELDLDLDVDKQMQPISIQQSKKAQSIKYQQFQNEPVIQSKDLGNIIEVKYTGPNAKGYLHAEQDSKNPKLYRVVRVTVDPIGQGYGKKLYIAAIKLATQKGAMLTSASNSTSESATHIWKSLYKDPKYQKTSLNPNDWPESPMNNRLMKKYSNLRFKDPNTYPPKNDIEFWSVNSGYMSTF